MKQARLEKKLSQTQLGKLLKVSQQTIGDWETKRDSLTTDEFKQLGRALGVEPGWLAFAHECPYMPKDVLDRETVKNVATAIGELLHIHQVVIDPETLATYIVSSSTMLAGESLEHIKNAIQALDPTRVARRGR